MRQKWLAGGLGLLLLLVACTGADEPTPIPADSTPIPAIPAESTQPATATDEIFVTLTGTHSPPVVDEEAAEEASVKPTETTAAPAATEALAEEPVSESDVSSDEPPGEPQPVTVLATDGLEIKGTFYPARGNGPWPAVLLLHMLGSDQQAWVRAGVPETLADAGYAALTIDMRGHGETGGQLDWPAVDDDLHLVWQSLGEREDVDVARIAVAGASIGANVALRAGANEPAIPTVILLSPGLDYRGVTTEDALATYGARPLLIIASTEDGYAAESSRTLAESAGENGRLQLYEGAGHGTNMFGREPELIELLLSWLDERL